jgi:AmmeMemoRadiSam system protein B
MHTVRPPAVAGLFYPADPAELATGVRTLLEAGQVVTGTRVPKALIVPHAGYVYSGPVAAMAYARLRPLAGRITRVVLLGPVHRVPVQGLALPQSTCFATPLGDIPLDTEAMARLAGLPQVVISERAHAMEHSLEVHLPFLQSVLGSFRLLPLAVGDATPAQVAEVLEQVWGGPETLVVISSDLSHFLPYREAQRIDRETVQHVLALTPDLDHHAACGATPVNGLLEFAGHHPLQAELIDLRNSGDTAGDRARVVGYASIAFYEASA